MVCQKGIANLTHLRVCVPRGAWDLVLHPNRFTKFGVTSAARLYEVEAKPFETQQPFLSLPPYPSLQGNECSGLNKRKTRVQEGVHISRYHLTSEGHGICSCHYMSPFPGNLELAL